MEKYRVIHFKHNPEKSMCYPFNINLTRHSVVREGEYVSSLTYFSLPRTIVCEYKLMNENSL